VWAGLTTILLVWADLLDGLERLDAQGLDVLHALVHWIQLCRVWGLQGYLALEKQPPLLGPP